jgi:flagellar hook assembly protein FlgD
MVEPKLSPRRIQSANLTARLAIYDVVNNTIVNGRTMVFDRSNTGWLYYVWDGRNNQGRRVANGTYLAVIEVDDGQGYKETVTLRVGVKR